MRYTVDELDDTQTDGVPEADPLLVVVSGLDRRETPLRDSRGNVVGMQFGGPGRDRLELRGDSEIIDRVRPICNALRDLVDHMDALHTVHRADGSEPDSPDEEAEIRTRMRFTTLAAHALLAVELVTDELS
jgi:hypothetical protein